MIKCFSYNDKYEKRYIVIPQY